MLWQRRFGYHVVDIRNASHIIKAGLFEFTAVTEQNAAARVSEHNLAQICFLNGSVGHAAVGRKSVAREKQYVGVYVADEILGLLADV